MTAKQKFKDTIITNAGRRLLIKVGAGESMLQYTRASINGQSIEGMDDYDVRNITTLTDQKMDTPIKAVSDIVDNNITVSASFNNKANTDDLEFNTVGWYAKLTTDDKETLLGITPTNGTLTLAGHSPDNISTESINLDLNMAISNAAKVDMKVNEIGIVYKQDLDAEITKVNDEIDKKIANYYTKSDIDSKLASLGDVKTVNNIKPDKNGNVQINVDASQQITNITYNKADIDKKLDAKADASMTYTKQDIDKSMSNKADKSDTYTKADIDAKLAPITNKDNDYENRIKYLEENAMIGKKFTDEKQAKDFSKAANHIAFIVTNS